MSFPFRIFHILFLFILFFFCRFHTAGCQPLSAHIVIQEIHIEGNKTTKAGIIYRELLFNKGDTVPAETFSPLLQRTRENILNTSLFNFVDIKTEYADSEHVSVFIHVQERWYTWPLPIGELAARNFNEWWLTKDFSRINYGIAVTQNNCRGRNETLKFITQGGYTQKLGIAYDIPYINKKKTDGLAWSIGYSRNHEIIYTTLKNKIQYYKDHNNYVKKAIGSSLRYSHRQKFYNMHHFYLEYSDVLIADTISVLNKDFFLDGKTRQQYMNVTYWFRHDHRDRIDYPLKGYYADVEVSKKGLGLIHDDVNMWMLFASIKNFWKLGHRFYASASIKGKLTDNAQHPYVNEGGLGYSKDYVRGYEYYVMEGQKFLLMKTCLKYNLVPPGIIKAGFIPLKKFNTIPYSLYFSIYADAGYSEDKYYYKNNPLSNSWLLGSGAGIDYVTYYDMLMRIEYSINKQGEHDLFLHFSKAF